MIATTGTGARNRSAEVWREIAPLAEEWEDLADRAGASPFLRPGWIAPWWSAFGRGALEVLTLREGGRLVAVLPLRRDKGALVATANSHTPEYGILAEDPDAADAMARAVIQRGARRLSLTYVPEADVQRVTRAASAARRPSAHDRLELSPYLPIEGKFEDYFGTIDGKLRRDLRRRLRRLGDEGEVVFETLDGRERLPELLDEGFAVEGSGWKDERGTAIDSNEVTRTFYGDVSAWAAERGLLRLSYLRLDGRVLAFQLAFEDVGSYFFIKGGFDPEMRKFAPQKLQVKHLIERAFEIGLDSFEFLGHVEDWKTEWTSLNRERHLVHAFSPLVGLPEWAGIRFGPPKVGRRIALVW